MERESVICDHCGSKYVAGDMCPLCYWQYSMVNPEKKSTRNMQEVIKWVCKEVCDMLLEKNKAYGDSASNPVRIFSKVDTIEQINIRIDDKLSRIARGHEYGTDDTELDLIGYLILKRAIKSK